VPAGDEPGQSVPLTAVLMHLGKPRVRCDADLGAHRLDGMSAAESFARTCAWLAIGGAEVELASTGDGLMPSDVTRRFVHAESG
jgi:hypothetical protein